MKTKTQTEKLKKEYKDMLKELKRIEEEHSVLEQEYKELNKNRFDINYKVDDLEEEVLKIRDNIKDEENNYIEEQEIKIVGRIVITTLIITTTLSFIFGKTTVTNTLIAGAVSTMLISPLVSFVILNSKSKNKIRNKYRQTESYIKAKELIEQKLKEINELKNTKVSLGDPYDLYKKVSNLEKQKEAKQKEIEDIKQQVFEIFFVDDKEENKKVEIANVDEEITLRYDEKKEKFSPLIKARRIDN